MGNVALNKTASASSSIAPFLPARAVDGSMAAVNRWMAHGTPCWLAVDLGAACWINRWVVRQPGVSGWSSPNYNLSDFKLQVSLDSVNWSDADIVTGNSASSVDRAFFPRLVRYARVYVTRGLGINQALASIMEFELYDVANGPLLTNLVPINGSLAPAFSSGVLAYTVSVASDISGIRFTPTAPAGMVIKVNGTTVASGQASQEIPLQTGSNNVTVKVTSADNSMTATYTVNVMKAGAVAATLSSLTGQNNRNQNVPLNPQFSSGILNYTASVANSVSSVKVIPASLVPNPTITVNGTPVTNGAQSGAINLIVGDTTITVTVGSSGYTSTVYMITVHRPA